MPLEPTEGRPGRSATTRKPFLPSPSPALRFPCASWTLALVAAAATSLTALAAPADAVGICTVGDLYNNMHDRCDGLVCYG